ncbi:unnamed protein product [Polarella glacialis]|uniref:Ubiquitin-like protease family profile domain-containing protein n=1 Tax=Polarella glacialis TaxID=89957 RepID=A0A813FHH9_POLGL|nr:unnamed protein product [Polarella glacialis]
MANEDGLAAALWAWGALNYGSEVGGADPGGGDANSGGRSGGNFGSSGSSGEARAGGSGVPVAGGGDGNQGSAGSGRDEDVDMGEVHPDGIDGGNPGDAGGGVGDLPGRYDAEDAGGDSESSGGGTNLGWRNDGFDVNTGSGDDDMVDPEMRVMRGRLRKLLAPFPDGGAQSPVRGRLGCFFERIVRGDVNHFVVHATGSMESLSQAGVEGILDISGRQVKVNFKNSQKRSGKPWDSVMPGDRLTLLNGRMGYDLEGGLVIVMAKDQDPEMSGHMLKTNAGGTVTRRARILDLAELQGGVGGGALVAIAAGFRPKISVDQNERAVRAASANSMHRHLWAELESARAHFAILSTGAGTYVAGLDIRSLETVLRLGWLGNVECMLLDSDLRATTDEVMSLLDEYLEIRGNEGYEKVLKLQAMVPMKRSRWYFAACSELFSEPCFGRWPSCMEGQEIPLQDFPRLMGFPIKDDNLDLRIMLCLYEKKSAPLETAWMLGALRDGLDQAIGQPHQRMAIMTVMSDARLLDLRGLARTLSPDWSWMLRVENDEGDYIVRVEPTARVEEIIRARKKVAREDEVLEAWSSQRALDGEEQLLECADYGGREERIRSIRIEIKEQEFLGCFEKYGEFCGLEFEEGEKISYMDVLEWVHFNLTVAGAALGCETEFDVVDPSTAREWIDFPERHELKEDTKYLLPVCRKSHWTLVKLVHKELNGDLVVEDVSWVEVPQQENRWDCGVFVMMHLWQLIAGRNPEAIRQREVTALRVEIACEISDQKKKQPRKVMIMEEDFDEEELMKEVFRVADNEFTRQFRQPAGDERGMRKCHLQVEGDRVMMMEWDVLPRVEKITFRMVQVLRGGAMEGITDPWLKSRPSEVAHGRAGADKGEKAKGGVKTVQKEQVGLKLREILTSKGVREEEVGARADDIMTQVGVKKLVAAFEKQEPWPALVAEVKGRPNLRDDDGGGKAVPILGVMEFKRNVLGVLLMSRLEAEERIQKTGLMSDVGGRAGDPDHGQVQSNEAEGVSFEHRGFELIHAGSGGTVSVKGTVINLREMKAVMSSPIHDIQMDATPSRVMRATIYRHLWEEGRGSWRDVMPRPVQAILDQLPGDRMDPVKAYKFHCKVRIVEEAFVDTLRFGGLKEAHVGPLKETGESDPSFTVTWLRGYTVQQARLKAADVEGTVTLAYNGVNFGLRSKVEDAMALKKQIYPSKEEMDLLLVSKRWRMGSFPYGFTRSDIKSYLERIGWAARPLASVGKGVWTVGAGEQNPPSGLSLNGETIGVQPEEDRWDQRYGGRSAAARKLTTGGWETWFAGRVVAKPEDKEKKGGEGSDVNMIDEKVKIEAGPGPVQQKLQQIEQVMAQKMQEVLEEAKEKFNGKSDERNQQADQRLDGLELKFSQIAKQIESGGLDGAGGAVNRLAEQQRVFEERITAMTQECHRDQVGLHSAVQEVQVQVGRLAEMKTRMDDKLMMAIQAPTAAMSAQTAELREVIAKSGKAGKKGGPYCRRFLRSGGSVRMMYVIAICLQTILRVGEAGNLGSQVAKWKMEKGGCDGPEPGRKVGRTTVWGKPLTSDLRCDEDKKAGDRRKKNEGQCAPSTKGARSGVKWFQKGLEDRRPGEADGFRHGGNHQREGVCQRDGVCRPEGVGLSDGDFRGAARRMDYLVENENVWERRDGKDDAGGRKQNGGPREIDWEKHGMVDPTVAGAADFLFSFYESGMTLFALLAVPDELDCTEFKAFEGNRFCAALSGDGRVLASPFGQVRRTVLGGRQTHKCYAYEFSFSSRFVGELPMQPLSLGVLEVQVEVIDDAAFDLEVIDADAVDAADDLDETPLPAVRHKDESGRSEDEEEICRSEEIRRWVRHLPERQQQHEDECGRSDDEEVDQEEQPKIVTWAASTTKTRSTGSLRSEERRKAEPSVEVPDRSPDRKTQPPGRDEVGEQRPSSGVGRAYASVVNCDRPLLAGKMVTHNWANIFSHLLGAVLADALGLETFDAVVELLVSGQFEELRERLRAKDSLELSYWVCAFSVNQHAGICDNPPAADSSGVPLQPCSCSTTKYLTGSFCEMNKFDEMMVFLKHANRLRRRQLRKLLTEEAAVKMKRFGQVVALDVGFELLSRVWCVAELVEAHRLHLPQALMIHSAASRENCLEKLRHLDVREAQASYAADKAFILGKIEDVDIFNEQLKGLLLRQLNLFLKGGDSLLLSAFRDTVIQVLAF